MKKATTVTPSSLFKPNERFIQTTFVRICRKKHDLTAEQSERVFESAKATGVLKHVSTWGAVAGIPIYVANPGTITSMNLHELALALVAYLKQRGYRWSEIPSHKNLIYIEGATLYAGQVTPNFDNPDGWNDLRIVLEFTIEGVPFISHIAKATCEPGTSATNSKEALKNGGVARLQLIQYREAAMMGFHKIKTHPALVQSGEILVYRDANRDQKRTGDPIYPAYGINHHSTNPIFTGEKVGMYSMGCCVGWNWTKHLEFIALMKTDPRYVESNLFKWDFALIDSAKLKNQMV